MCHPGKLLEPFMHFDVFHGMFIFFWKELTECQSLETWSHYAGRKSSSLLSVNFKITYTIAILPCQVEQTGQSEYLSEYTRPLVWLVHYRRIRSSATDLEYDRGTNSTPTNISCRAFSLAAFTVWNSLTTYLTTLLRSQKIINEL